MKEALWSAIEAQFQNDEQLVASARRIYLADDADPTRDTLPLVQVSGSDDVSLDTFGADIESHRLTFTFWGRQRHKRPALTARQHLTRVFDHCSLPSAEFATVGFRRIGGTSPTIEDGRWTWSVEYECIVQWVLMEPSVRG
jgi:hypothetical protein